MKIKEKILILKWGKNANNIYWTKQKIIFPKKAPILINFIQKEIVGYGTNFKNTSRGIICDINYKKKHTNTIAPGFKVKDIMFDEKENQIPIDVELIELSFVNKHANIKCINNLK